MQFGFLLVSICIAFVSGSIVGWIANNVSPDREFYVDGENWEINKPYYFDLRGEVEHDGNSSSGLAEVEKRIKELEKMYLSKSQ
jgi:hypothetical protein